MFSVRVGKAEGGIMGHKIHIIGNSKGFTLVEILIAMVISTIIMGAILMASMAGQQAASGIEQKVVVQEDVRAALDLMALEIGMASYNPKADKTLLAWQSAACGTGTAANKGIQQATASNLTVEMDLNGNGSVADANENITYSYANSQITRSVSCGAAQALIGGVNVNVINNAGTPVFQYFDGNNNTTANIPDIRRIVITLVVQSSTADLNGQSRTMVYSTSVIPRNHIMSVQ